MRINAKGLHWSVATLADGRSKTYWLVCLARRAAIDRRVRLARVHHQLQCRHRHQGRRAQRTVAVLSNDPIAQSVLLPQWLGDHLCR
jgi:hypothetical protein